jgi:hypothetical protein
MNSVDGWYLRTSDEHYRCHVIYIKHSNSKSIPDTVHFKHKHITARTLTPEDTLVKALNDLTHALKERQNTKGTAEIEALQKLDKLLNKIPTTTIAEQSTMQITTTRSVTFDSTSKPPQEIQPNPRVQIATQTSKVQKVTPTPRVQEATPTPRVQSTPPTLTNATINKPLQQNTSNTTRRSPTSAQTKLRDKIKDARNLWSRLALRTHMQLHPQEQLQRQWERIQLI